MSDQLGRFWSLTETNFPLGGPRRHLIDLLGDETVAALEGAKLLSYQRMSDTYPCHHPGGDGCPRQVIEMEDDSYHAVCGNDPRECDDLVLQQEDLEHLGVVPKALCESVARALQVKARFEEIDGLRSVYRIGTFIPDPGVRQPVFLAVRCSGQDYAEVFDALRSRQERGGFAVLVPTDRFLSDDTARLMASLGIPLLPLDDVVGIDDGKLTALVDPLTFFEGIGQRGPGMVTSGPSPALERLPCAREPDWHVDTEWKHHELWWAAEGGDAATTCDPVAVPDCDEPNRSDRWLTDTTDDAAPAGVEPGSLASLGDVTGAIVYVKGTRTGHYMYRRRVAETASGGRVRLEALPEAYTEGCWFDHDPSMPNLGWHSKYYLEGLAKFLDTPGEWFFDEATQTLYVWTPDGQSPDQLGMEISVRDRGIDLSHRSYIELEDLDILLFADEGIRITGSGSEDDRCYGITLTGLDIGWSTRGLHLAHGPEPSTAPGSQTRQLTLRDSVVHDMESLAIYFWTGSGEEFARPGITDVRIFHNELARIGFRDNEQGGVGMSFGHADHFLFQGNHVHHIAHNGVVFSKAQTQSSPGHHVEAAAI